MSLDTLSNLSYTNKDFNSIYSELLEYAGKLSYKWDPVTSDESDPGVVLLKLAAIVADKDNYNIDKNILELMPASVTQLAAARQVFEQCGYTMSYYRSAVGKLQLTLKKEPERGNDATDAYYSYEIPRFTMFSDIDNSVVFTSLTPAIFDVNDDALTTEQTQPVTVIQGVVKDYTINGDTLITLANLDSRNRVYFTEMDIAENGIFISSTSDFSEMDAWKRVEVLELSDPSERCYRFGIDAEMTKCYIEFSDSIDKIIGEGLYIKYVRTSGSNGNVAAKRISQFFVETKAVRKQSFGLDSAEVDVTTDNIYIINPLPIVNGQDLETIEEAYRNYKRVKNTFDTLVSLTDYTDHMVSSKHASNGYVCDRTNDIQHTYKIVAENNVKKTKLNKVLVDKECTYVDASGVRQTGILKIEEPALTAFDLSIYGLEYKTNVISEDDYLSTFKLQSYKALRDTGGYIHYLAPEQTDVSDDADLLTQATLRCIQHDFKIEHATDTILMIKNKYPVNAHIIPQYKLTQAQFQEVLASIQRSLFSALNAKMVDFGAPVNYDTVYEAIRTADSRIRSVSLDYPTYQTYAVYLPSKQRDDQTTVTYKELRIDNDSPGGYRKLDAIELKQLPDTTVVGYYDSNGTFKSNIKWSDIDPLIKTTSVIYIYDADLETLWNKFRVEIYARSVLSGVTPLYTQDSAYAYGPNQADVTESEDITSLTTNTDIVVEKKNERIQYESVRKLDTNENVLFTAPNYVTENQYSSYVKMIYDFPSLSGVKTLAKDSIYQLDNQDFIVFFWKASADDSDYRYIKYSSDTASRAKSISTTFNLPATQPVATEALRDIVPDGSAQRAWEQVVDYFRKLKTTGQEASTSANLSVVLGQDANGAEITITETDLITKFSSGNRYNVLTGTQTVYTKNPNTIQPNDRQKTSGDLFWILNDSRHVDNNGVEMAQLFDTSESRYTLQTGEYLLYTNPSKTALHLLGSGTVLERDNTDSAWLCPVIEYSELSEKGPSVLTDHWQVPDGILHATEMQQVQIGPGYQFSVSEVPSSEILADPLPNRSAQGSIETSEAFTFSSKPTLLPSTAQITYTDGLTSTVLPAVPEGWTVQTLLNLNVGPNRPQQLRQETRQQTCLYNQSVKINDLTPYSGCYFLSTQELAAVGGQKILVKSKSPFSTNPVRILTYKDPLKASDNDTVTISYPVDSFSCMITASATGTQEFTCDVPLSLLPGRYLLKLVCNVELESLRVELPKVEENSLEPQEALITLSPFPADNQSDVCCLYQVDVQSNTYNDSIVVSFVSKNTDTLNISIEPFYKYTDVNLSGISVGQSNVSFEQSLLSRIDELDYDKEFDYLHSVVESEEIVNPLISSSFLNPRHVMNSFTICQWNLDEAVPRIEILNNMR